MGDDARAWLAKDALAYGVADQLAYVCFAEAGGGSQLGEGDLTIDREKICEPEPYNG